MITRSHRFHGHGGLRAVYQRGQTVRNAQLSLKYAYRNSARGYRLAVVVSRKVSKSAVVRNRIRRRLYEIVRQQASGLPAGLDLVLTVFSSDVADTPQAGLEAAVSGLLKKAIPDSDGQHAIVKATDERA